MMSDYSRLPQDFLKQVIRDGHREFLNGIIETIVDALITEIRTGQVNFKPIWYIKKRDASSGKIRVIGVQSAKQQFYDYIAVFGLKELFKKKIGYYQCAAIKGRGQVFGKRALERFLRQKSSRVAAQGDIRKCYESIDTERLKELLQRYVHNDLILQVTFRLIDSFRKGLSIGSFLSQFLCNFFLSFAYHYASEKLFRIKKHRNGSTERVRLISHVLFYMDDFILIGSRKADVKKAMEQLIRYLKEFLHLEVKKEWKLFHIDYDKDGIHRGQPIDMMGFKVYRDRVEIRRRIFLRARKAFQKALVMTRRKKDMPLDLARKCVSYYGWFKNSDSFHFIKKYRVEDMIKIARRRVSHESKIFGTTAASKMAAA